MKKRIRVECYLDKTPQLEIIYEAKIDKIIEDINTFNDNNIEQISLNSYYGEYQNKEVIGFEAAFEAKTLKECELLYKDLKNILKNTFGKSVKETIKLKSDVLW